MYATDERQLGLTLIVQILLRTEVKIPTVLFIGHMSMKAKGKQKQRGHVSYCFSSCL